MDLLETIYVANRLIILAHEVDELSGTLEQFHEVYCKHQPMTLSYTSTDIRSIENAKQRQSLKHRNMKEIL